MVLYLIFEILLIYHYLLYIPIAYSDYIHNAIFKYINCFRCYFGVIFFSSTEGGINVLLVLQGSAIKRFVAYLISNLLRGVNDGVKQCPQRLPLTPQQAIQRAAIQRVESLQPTSEQALLVQEHFCPLEAHTHAFCGRNA